MHAIALSTSDAFQTIDSTELTNVSGGYDLGQAVRAGNAAAPLGEEAGKNLGPLTGATIGAIGGGLTGGPIGAVGGGVAGAEIGSRWGGDIGKGIGFGAGFIGDTWNQLTN